MKVRKPNVEELHEEGIPVDFFNSMNLFNRLLQDNQLPFCPRKTKINLGEVRDLWVPSVDKNITYLAYEDDCLVASGTLFVVEGSNQYSIDSRRGNEFGLIFDSNYLQAVKEVTRRVIREAKEKGIRFVAHVSVDDEKEIKMFEELGYSPTKTIDNYERYAEGGLSPRVYEYII